MGIKNCKPLGGILKPLRCWFDCPVPGHLGTLLPLQHLPVQHVQDAILLVQGLVLPYEVCPDFTVACAELVYVGLVSTGAW